MADGKIIATYFKCELPNYGVFDEKRYFSPGQEAVVFELGGLKFGLNICEDTWLEHSPAKAAQQGAQVLLVLNASPFCTSKQSERSEERREGTGCVRPCSSRGWPDN